MAFVIGKIDSVRKKVTFEDFGDDGKKAVKSDFIAILKVQDAEVTAQRKKDIQDFWTESRRELKKLEKDENYEVELPEGAFDEKFLTEDVIGLEGILDADKNEIEFSEDLLSQVLLNRRARAALMKVWNDLNFQDGVKKGN